MVAFQWVYNHPSQKVRKAVKKKYSSIGPTTRALTPPSLLLVVMPQVEELFAVSFRIFNQQI